MCFSSSEHFPLEAKHWHYNVKGLESRDKHQVIPERILFFCGSPKWNNMNVSHWAFLVLQEPTGETFTEVDVEPRGAFVHEKAGKKFLLQKTCYRKHAADCWTTEESWLWFKNVIYTKTLETCLPMTGKTWLWVGNLSQAAGTSRRTRRSSCHQPWSDGPTTTLLDHSSAMKLMHSLWCDFF